ncbi:phage tail assembly chaperone [Sphingobium sp.]|uniref:phage tail assembly chaperone n=1 Tax=Sphingobium sp. TaxID=1912891 RepID=UPI003B3A2610
MTRFADAAGRLAGVAGWLLGWRPDEFWRATPAELACVLRAAVGEDGPEGGVDGAELQRLMGVMPDVSIPFGLSEVEAGH